MQHIWSVLCQNSIIDKDTNLFSLNNCIEELSIDIDRSKMPEPQKDKIVIPIEFNIVNFWIDDDTTKERKFFVEIDLIDPDNKTLNTTSAEYIMKKGVKRFRNRIKAQGLSITKDGRYWFKIKMKEKKKDKFKEVGELPLDINISYKILDKIK